MVQNLKLFSLIIFGFNFYLVKSADNRRDGDPHLRNFLQPNHVTNGEYDHLTTAEAEAKGICTRPCDGAKPMICYYHFTFENYATVGPACGNCSTGELGHCNNKYCVPTDGFERAVLTANRQIPGPSIQVCMYDTIVVDVENKLMGKTTTIHWHGLYQRYTPFMDGVQFLTQCPILHNTKFRYKFPAIPDGTFFWHSHIALQKMDGLEGSLVIREPKSEDKTSSQWDFDLPSHVIIITDWLHDMTDERWPGFVVRKAGSFPDTYLINGRNRYQFPNGTTLNAQYSQFNVQKGYRYRFRIIGGSCLACPYLVTFEKHKMLLIATDGTPTEVEEFDSITMVAGDRMDVVIRTNDGNPGDSYWIQVKSLCPGPFNNTQVHAEAILHYTNGSPRFQATPSGARPNGDTYPRGRSLNAGDQSDCSDGNNELVCMSHIDALEPPVNPIVLRPDPTFELVVGIDFHQYDVNSLFYNDQDKYHKWFQPAPGFLDAALLRNISFEYPPFPLLTQINQLPVELQCPDDGVCLNEANTTDVCECTQILKYELDSVGEIIFIDYSGPGLFYHPMHLHGNDMYIIEQGKIPANYTGNVALFAQHLQERLRKERPNLMKKRAMPVVKDTIGNIPKGYTVVRVHFNNPGFWFLHCHFIFHTDAGMGLVLQIGEKYQMRNPPAFFPRCDNFLPPVYPHEFDTAMFGERLKRNFDLDNQK